MAEINVADLPHHPAACVLPMLAGNELRELAEDVAEYGLREPIWLWREPESGAISVLDGRNRIAACEMAGVQVLSRFYTGTDPISFVVSLNVARRHLTPGQRAMLALELVPLFEEQGRKDMARAASAARRRKSQPHEGQADLPDPKPPQHQPHRPQSRDKAASATGASGRAVGQAKRIIDKAPDLAEKVRNGDMPIDRADRIIRDRDAEQRRIEQAKAEAAATAITTVIDIRHGDFREVLADLTDIDAIITDPPYPHEFLPLLGDLAAWADKVLTTDGILAVLIGQSYLPDVYRLLAAGRPYRWTACYLTSGSGYVSHPRGVQSNWKPLIVYGGVSPRFSDVIRTGATDCDAKNNHKWGQDYSAFHTIVERLTTRGQTIVDPFMGSGTTILAAHALGRHAIGSDTDGQSVARARERLA